MNGACRCDREWNGLRESHCARCHQHFSTVRNFDRHQRRVGDHVICLPPTLVGLIPHDTSNGTIWRESGAGRPDWRSRRDDN